MLVVWSSRLSGKVLGGTKRCSDAWYKFGAITGDLSASPV